MLSRIIASLGVLVAVSVVIFLSMRVVPGDPVTVLTAGAAVSEQTKENLREAYHLKDPLPVQYGHWALDALHGDLGTSLKGQRPVTTMIGKSLPITLYLIIGGSLVAFLVSTPLGVIAGFREGTATDRGVVAGSLMVLSIPVFTSSVLAILIFSYWLDLLPAVGRGDGSLWGTVEHLVLPSLVLGLSLAAVQTQTFRASVIDVLSQEYVEGAELRGLRPRRILGAHILRTAMLPVVTLIGLTFGTMMVGTVLIDYVFGLGGIGSLLVDSVQSRDYPVIQGVVMLIAVVFVLANIAVDLVGRRLDPRYTGSDA